MINIQHKLNFANARLFYLVLALATLPIWIVHYLPGVDFPGQAAQAAALQEIWRDNPVFVDQFEINLLTPYLFGTTLLALLSFVMPAAFAAKFLMASIIVATTLISGRLLGAVGGDPDLRWLVIPSTYSFAFYWGFFPFLTAVPLGLILILLAVRLNENPTVRMGVIVAAFSLLVLASHLLVLCLSSLLALAWLAGRNFRQPKRLITLSVPFMAPLPLIIAWLAVTLGGGSYMSTNRIGFGSYLKRVPDMIEQSSGLDGTFVVVSYFVFIVIVTLPLASGMKLTRKPEKWLMAFSGFATFMLFPTYVMGTAFVFDRFGLFLPLLWFILWERTPSSSQRWQWLGILAVFVLAGANVLRFSTFNLETKGFENVMTKMEPGKRTYSMMIALRSSQFSAPVFLHFPSWYQVEKRGIVDYNFGMFHNTVVRYQANKRLPRTEALAWSPHKFDWFTDHGASYDYFVVRSQFDASAELFGKYDSTLELVLNDGWWWLYRKVETEH